MATINDQGRFQEKRHRQNAFKTGFMEGDKSVVCDLDNGVPENVTVTVPDGTVGNETTADDANTADVDA